MATASERENTDWVFQTVINQPPLMVWAAFSDIARRVAATVPTATGYDNVKRTNTCTLVNGRPFMVGATWKLVCVVETNSVNVDEDGVQSSSTTTATAEAIYRLTESVPGERVVFTIQMVRNENIALALPIRLASYFRGTPNGGTEVTEVMPDPVTTMTCPMMCAVLCTCGLLLCCILCMRPRARQEYANDLEKLKAHVETLDAAAWMAGVQNDLQAMRSNTYAMAPTQPMAYYAGPQQPVYYPGPQQPVYYPGPQQPAPAGSMVQ